MALKYDQNTQEGFDYQIRIIQLYLLHGVTNDIKSFKVHTEVIDAGKFDDVIFEFTDESGKLHYTMLQAKHRQDAAKSPITLDLLFNGRRGKDFLLSKYFLSFKEIMNNAVFNNATIDKLILFTNADFDTDVYEQLKLEIVQDDIIGNLDSEARLYKLEKGNILPKIQNDLSQRTARILVNFVLNNTRIEYETFNVLELDLLYNVIDTKNNLFLDNFVKDVNLSDGLKYFRDVFGTELGKYSKKKLSIVNINQALTESKKIYNRPIGLNLSESFRNELSQTRDEFQIENDIYDFLDRFVLAVKQPNDKKLRSIVENKIKTDLGFNPIQGQLQLYDHIKKISQAKVKNINYDEAKNLFEGLYIRFNVSQPIASFTGREETLVMLHKKIQRNSETPTVISQIGAITGLGGIGKTQLAKKYIDIYYRKYQSNIVWINSETDKIISDDFKVLASDKLNINLKTITGDAKSIRTIVDEVYRYFSKKKVLFVFDNCENTEDFQKYLPSNILPPHVKHPYVLMTSRERRWGDEIELVDLEVLTMEETACLIKTQLKINNESCNDQIKQLSEELQCLPLAVQQAVSYISNQRKLTPMYTIDNYLDEFKQKSYRLLKSEAFKKTSGYGYDKTTYTTWLVTFDQIQKDEEYGELAMKILKVIIYIYAENIPKKMFLDLADSDESELNSVVSLLVSYSLVNYDNSDGMLNIHRLVQHVIRLYEKCREGENIQNVFNLLNTCSLNIDTHKGFVWDHACRYDEFIDQLIVDKIHNDLEETPQIHYIIKNNQFETLKVILKHIKKKDPCVMREILNQRNSKNFQRACLHLAAAYGYSEIVKLLLDANADVNIIDILNYTVLHVTVGNCNTETVRALIKKGAKLDVTSTEGFTILHMAARWGKKEMVLALLEEGVSVDTATNKGFTALHWASRFGNREVVLALLEKGANLSTVTKNGYTALHWAAQYGNTEIVMSLIEKGANLNAVSNAGFTAFYLAVANGHTETVLAFCEKSAGLDAVLYDSYTALHCAARYGKKEIVLALVEKGASLHTISNEGFTALHLAAEYGHTETLLVLIEKGANLEAVTNDGSTAFHLAAKKGYKEVILLLMQNNVNIDAEDNRGLTAFHRALFNSRKDIAEYLFECKVNTNPSNNSDMVDLCKAASKGDKSKLSLLLQKGVDVNTASYYGWTAFHHATYNGHKSIASYLCEMGADINKNCHIKRTALHYVSCVGYEDMVLFLMEKGANVNTIDNLGLSPLASAACKGNTNIVSILLENEADVNTIDHDENNALCDAVFNGHKNIVILLLKYGADVNFINRNSQTPLHYAVSRGYKDIAWILIENGADITATDKNGKTALDIAIINDNRDILSLFKEKETNNIGNPLSIIGNFFTKIIYGFRK